MQATYFLGADGGGTKCRVRLADRAGRVLAEAEGGPANINLDHGRTAFLSLTQASHAACAKAGLDPSVLSETVAALGLAGAEVGDAQGVFAALPFPFLSTRLYSDGEIACVGAHSGQDGAIVILGTGAKVSAVVDGEFCGKSGWGFWLADYGSGADIGRSAVRRVGLAIDEPPGGALETPALTEAVLARCGGDPVALAGWAKRAAPGDYGSLAPLVFDLADAGDPPAREIIQDAAGHFTRMIRLARGLGTDRVSPIGSVAQRLASDWTDPSDTRLTSPDACSTQGAVLAAMWGGLRAQSWS